VERSDRARLAPLVLATMASQALLVALTPTIVAVGADLGASVGAVGQARSIAAATAIAVSAAIASRVDALGVRRLLALGAAVAVAACAAVAAAPALPAFLLAHVLVGAALACLLSAGFAGAAAFPAERRTWAIGWVAAANALAWIVVSPLVGVVAERLSWRVAEVVPAAVALAALAASPAAGRGSGGRPALDLRTLVANRSARRWIGAELAAYGAWATLLTFVGAFFVGQLGVPEAVAGWLLALGAAAFFAAATSGAGLVAGAPRRRLVAAASLLMAVLFVVQLGLSGSAAVASAAFCLLGLAAGVRTPVSSALGVEQLPEHPGAMMAARTAANQLGYLLGAVVGGTVIAVAGFGALGVVLAATMAVSALLMLRVDDPRETAGRPLAAS
jgi:predicted MFS family arabinose efflux permease